MRPLLAIVLALALAGCEAAVRIGESGRIYMSPTEPLNATIAPPAGDACVSGGKYNTASGSESSVSGGGYNDAQSTGDSITGGRVKSATASSPPMLATLS